MPRWYSPENFADLGLVTDTELPIILGNLRAGLHAMNSKTVFEDQNGNGLEAEPNLTKWFRRNEKDQKNHLHVEPECHTHADAWEAPPRSCAPRVGDDPPVKNLERIARNFISKNFPTVLTLTLTLTRSTQ